MKYTLSVRIHIHASIANFWLTPQALTIRPNETARPDSIGYIFTARARFDDSTLGDVTEDHNITWFSPNLFPKPFDDLDKIVLRAGDNPGGTSITVTALLPVALDGASASAALKIAQSWGAPTNASIVVGGSRPKPDDPAVVSNPDILFLCDGFTNTQVDRDCCEQLTNSIFQRFKTIHLATPFRKLATSMIFWLAFIPSDVRGISVYCEVYTKVEADETRAFMVNNPLKPSADGDSSLENVVYTVAHPFASAHDLRGVNRSIGITQLCLFYVEGILSRRRSPYEQYDAQRTW